MPTDAKPAALSAPTDNRRLERNTPGTAKITLSGASVVVLAVGSWVSTSLISRGDAHAMIPLKQVVKQPASETSLGFLANRPTQPTAEAYEVPASLSADVRASVASRIHALQGIAEEEEIVWNDVAEKQLWRFLDRLQSPSRPAIAIDQNGDLRVLWENMLQEQVAVRFKGSPAVEAVLFQKTEHGVRREVLSADPAEVSRLIREMKLLHVTRG